MSEHAEQMIDLCAQDAAAFALYKHEHPEAIAESWETVGLPIVLTYRKKANVVLLCYPRLSLESLPTPPAEHDGGRVGCNHVGGMCSDAPPAAGEPEREALRRVLTRMNMASDIDAQSGRRWTMDAAADYLISEGYRRQPEPREVTTVEEWTDPKPWLYRNGSRTAHKLPQMHVERRPRTRAQYENDLGAEATA